MRWRHAILMTLKMKELTDMLSHRMEEEEILLSYRPRPQVILQQRLSRCFGICDDPCSVEDTIEVGDLQFKRETTSKFY